MNIPLPGRPTTRAYNSAREPSGAIAMSRRVRSFSHGTDQATAMRSASAAACSVETRDGREARGQPLVWCLLQPSDDEPVGEREWARVERDRIIGFGSDSCERQGQFMPTGQAFQPPVGSEQRRPVPPQCRRSAASRPAPPSHGSRQRDNGSEHRDESRRITGGLDLKPASQQYNRHFPCVIQAGSRNRCCAYQLRLLVHPHGTSRCEGGHCRPGLLVGIGEDVVQPHSQFGIVLRPPKPCGRV